ncbi:MAG: NAD+ synthase, partial [Bacteroidetes bacterium]|nr:NAD+ synthase [Bacteroidota bacterium]
MKIAIAQLNFHIGNFELNESKIIDSINKAKKANSDIIIFSELAISGYPPRDFLEFEDFIEKCHKSIEVIAKECVEIAAVIGAPSINPNIKGKNLFNSAFFLAEGKIKSIINKTLLPTYDVFDEYRYFEPNSEFKVIEYFGKKLAITICEDLWNISDDPMYTVNPMDELTKQNPDFIINIAASPFHYKQREARIDILKKNIEKYQIPLFYSNHVGAQTELLFDGGSMAINTSGEIFEMNYFEEDFRVFDTEQFSTMYSGNNNETPIIERIHDALVMGIRNYFHKLGFNKAILGLSGGIDSAVVLVLAERALGKENVKALLLPS